MSAIVLSRRWRPVHLWLRRQVVLAQCLWRVGRKPVYFRPRVSFDGSGAVAGCIRVASKNASWAANQNPLALSVVMAERYGGIKILHLVVVVGVLWQHCGRLWWEVRQSGHVARYVGKPPYTWSMCLRTVFQFDFTNEIGPRCAPFNQFLPDGRSRT